MAGEVAQLERELSEWLGVSGVATGFGRSALRLAFETLDCAGRIVLLPDFICTQVVQAAQEAGARIAFFPVSRDLSIRLEEFAAAVSSYTPAAVVIPHYFGWVTSNIAKLVAVCRARGAAAIEDCALALGASLNSHRAGTFGDMAVFSFTKSDWCFGGGMLAIPSETHREKARSIRDTRFCVDEGLASAYGRLRRLDWIANRPRRATAAARAGQRLQRSGSIREENFYDAGRCDLAMGEGSARRASQILSALDQTAQCRRALCEQIVQGLDDARRIVMNPAESAEGSGAFLLLASEKGNAREWVRRAAEREVTLRLNWAAYQDRVPGQASETLDWIAEHLVILEIHSRLTRKEMDTIVRCLRNLAEEDGS